MDEQENNSPTSQRSPFKFGLRHLFYATALIATGLALSPITIWLSAAVLLVWGLFFFFESLRNTILGWGLVLLFVLSGFILPANDYQHHYNSVCSMKLRLLARALMDYESTHGHFPTDRLVTLADGTELRHSWRIEILPFIAGDAIYDSYNFNEPWNGPNNSKLESPMPKLFDCPYRDHGTKTPYKLVNGPGTAFEVGLNSGVVDVKDGYSNTICLIEDHANPANWMEPEDLSAQEAARAMNSITMETAAHIHESPFRKTAFGLNYATMDGRVERWPPLPDKPMDPGAFLIDDGYFLDSDIGGQWLEEIKYGEIFILAIYLLLAVLPALSLLRQDTATSAG